MYKVAILDDQPFVREGLRAIIDWRSLECELVGEWETAVAAVRELERIRPDIVISDIVMPGMDGLALMDLLNRMGIPSKVVFLSAHRNFEYAQRAIELGAIEYLVKPTDPNAVVRAVLKCIQRIEAERKLADPPAKPPEQEAELEMLSLLLHRSAAPSASFDSRLYYAVIAVQFEQASPDAAWQEQSVGLLRRKLKLDIAPVILPVMDKVVVVAAQPEEEPLRRQAVEWAEEIQFWHRQLLDLSVSVAVGPIGLGTERLYRQYAETLQLLEKTFYYGNESILTVFEVQPERVDREAGGSVEMRDRRETNREEALLAVIRQVDEERAALLLDEWFEQFGRDRIGPYEIKFEVCKWILHAAAHMPPDQDREVWDKHAQSVLAMNSLADIKERVRRIALLMMESFRTGVNSHHRQLIHQVEQYVKRHYGDPDASLMKVAEHVHLSANYVSRLIKRNAGKTFTEWLNEYRMEEAKKLLRLPDCKSYQAAERVGIPDARYFSQLFRKYTGMTPTEFKNRAGNV
jgi:two-component system response regulator YesN